VRSVTCAGNSTLRDAHTLLGFFGLLCDPLASLSMTKVKSAARAVTLHATLFLTPFPARPCNVSVTNLSAAFH
jgi:hypothetical protein